MSVYCQIGTCIDAIYNVLADQLDILDGPKLVISKYEFKPAKTKIPPRSQYQPIVERDIFQTRTADSVTKIEKIIIEDIKPTERNLKLWGTVVGNGTASAYAIIEEPGTRSRRNRQSLHKPGDVVQGATIKNPAGKSYFERRRQERGPGDLEKLVKRGRKIRRIQQTGPQADY